MSNWLIETYHALTRGGRSTFRLSMRCREYGVNHFLRRVMGFDARIKPNKEKMEETVRFLQENRGRIRKMLSYLADEESRVVWETVMECRKQGKLVPERCYSDRNQYFAPDIISLRDDEVFIDCGAFIGDTLQHLLNASKKQGISIKRMIAFEPDQRNLESLMNHFGKDSRVSIIPMGLSDSKGILQFSPAGPAGMVMKSANADLSGTIEIPVTTLDMQEECAEATFIKMDIEGSELAALRGAHETIRRNHPKLAICIYHSLEDMVGIIEYIHENFPEYNLYVRHHAITDQETVMYAVCPEDNVR